MYSKVRKIYHSFKSQCFTMLIGSSSKELRIKKLQKPKEIEQNDFLKRRKYLDKMMADFDLTFSWLLNYLLSATIHCRITNF